MKKTLSLLSRELQWAECALGAAMEGFLGLNAEGRCTFVNRSALRQLGYEQPSDLLGRLVHPLIHHHRPDGTELGAEDCPILRALRHGESCHADTDVFWRKDGSCFPVEYWSIPVAPPGAPTGTVVTFLDITERRHTEAKLGLQATAMESAANGIVITDTNGAMQWVNEAFARLTGYSAAELIGRNPRVLKSGQHPPEFYGALWSTVKAGKVWRGEIVNRRKDGTLYCEEMTITPVSATGDGITHFVAIKQDITARKEAEATLREMNATLESRVVQRTAALTETVQRLQAETAQRTRIEADLRESNDRLHRLALDLTRAEEKERRRLAQILHDHLQQLLVATRLNLDWASNHTQAPELLAELARGREAINEAVNECRSLTVELAPPMLRGGGLARALPWLATWMKQKHRLEVTLDVDPHLPPQDYAVASLLFQSVREALFNVVKHSDVKAATVSVRQPEPGQLRLEVADQGRGFDPVRLASPAVGEGGFGLFSIRDRLHLLGGHMEIQSAPGKGTRLSLVVPFTPAPLPEVPTAPEAVQAAPPPAPSAPPMRRWRVVLADDHAVVRRGLVRVLEHEPDFEVVGEAPDGETAVSLSESLRPDLVIMDIEMPRLDGIEATRRIHSSQPDVRVVALSVHEEAELAGAIRQAGAVEMVQKHAPTGQLLSTLRRVGTAVAATESAVR